MSRSAHRDHVLTRIRALRSPKPLLHYTSLRKLRRKQALKKATKIRRLERECRYQIKLAEQQNRRQAKRQIFNEAKDELKAGGHQIDPFDSYSDSSSSVIRINE